MLTSSPNSSGVDFIQVGAQIFSKTAWSSVMLQSEG